MMLWIGAWEGVGGLWRGQKREKKEPSALWEVPQQTRTVAAKLKPRIRGSVTWMKGRFYTSYFRRPKPEVPVPRDNSPNWRLSIRGEPRSNSSICMCKNSDLNGRCQDWHGHHPEVCRVQGSPPGTAPYLPRNLDVPLADIHPSSYPPLEVIDYVQKPWRANQIRQLQLRSRHHSSGIHS